MHGPGLLNTINLSFIVIYFYKKNPFLVTGLLLFVISFWFSASLTIAPLMMTMTRGSKTQC